jgi:adenylate cyclase
MCTVQGVQCNEFKICKKLSFVNRAYGDTIEDNLVIVKETVKSRGNKQYAWQRKQEVFMATEIERKFLVKNSEWQKESAGKKYKQGYFPVAGRAITLRVRSCGEKAFITIKGEPRGFSRTEFEYEIPVKDADIMLDTLCLKPLIEKTRYLVKVDDLLWELDVFHGENEGLIIAEVELESEAQQIVLPNWIKREVTGELKYCNSTLVRYPFSKWSELDKKKHWNE